MLTNIAHSRNYIYIAKILKNFTIDTWYITGFLFRNPNIILHAAQELVKNTVSVASFVLIHAFAKSICKFSLYGGYDVSPGTEKSPLSDYLLSVTGESMKMQTIIDPNKITGYEGGNILYLGMEWSVTGGVATDGSEIDQSDVLGIFSDYFCGGQG